MALGIYMLSIWIDLLSLIHLLPAHIYVLRTWFHFGFGSFLKVVHRFLWWHSGLGCHAFHHLRLQGFGGIPEGFIWTHLWLQLESHGIHGQSMELHGNQEEEKEEDEVKNRDRQRGESERKRGKKKNEKER